MDQNHRFERHYDHIQVHLVDRDHERACVLQLWHQCRHQVSEGELTWCILTDFAIVINPVTNIGLRLLLRRRVL